MTREELLDNRQFLNVNDIMTMFKIGSTAAYKKIREIKSFSNIARMSGKILVKDYEKWLAQ